MTHNLLLLLSELKDVEHDIIKYTISKMISATNFVY
jgi:hypothetical protein